MKGIVMAMITFPTPEPKTDTIAKAMIISGNAMKISMIRWKMRSNSPPR
jgi:hypothetical protein